MATVKALVIAGALALAILGLFTIIAWIIPILVFLILAKIIFVLIRANQQYRPPR